MQDFSVADIQFAFNNRNLIQLMKKRGTMMAQGNLQGTKTINKEIDDYMKSKVGRKEMNTIIAAYVTFNTEEGHDEAQNYIREPRKFVDIKSILNDQMMNKFLSGVGFLKKKTYDKLNIDHLKLLG